jgi:hypothetical protein
MDWEKVKAVALVWYGKAAALFLFQNLGFLYHCSQWRGL